jgi:NitT/TauT family transport system permease protein
MKKKRKKNNKSNYSILHFCFAIIILLIFIEAFVRLFKIPEYIIPSPSKVIIFLFKNIHKYKKDIGITIKEVAFGFMLGWIIAFIFSIIANFSKLFRIFVRPIIVLSQTIPIIAVAPILILWFGFGIMPKVITAALLVIFPTFIGISEAFLNVPVKLFDFMNACRSKKIEVFIYIQIPQAIPNIIVATKIGITLSVIGAIIGEFITAEYGIGLQIRKTISEVNTIATFGMIYILSILGISLYSILDVFEALLKKKYRRIE